VFDFGLRAPEPAHRVLLDFLADEFMKSGWSFRHLHRLIVTSQAYRLSSSTVDADPATLQSDPTNIYYCRMNARRMESQVVRDCLLQLAGELDLTMGGPSVDPAKLSLRRSLYFQHSRDQQDKFLDMFDDADHLQCYRRTESIVPQQALALANSKLSLDMSAKIAEQITDRLSPASADSATRDAYIRAAFELLLGRELDELELQECRVFCDEVAELRTSETESQQEARVRTRLVHALLNHNDFISIR